MGNKPRSRLLPEVRLNKRDECELGRKEQIE